jgi:hypothetical protein
MDSLMTIEGTDKDSNPWSREHSRQSERQDALSDDENLAKTLSQI